MNRIIPVILSLLICSTLVSCRAVPRPVSKSGFALGTFVNITLFDGSPETLLNEAFEEINRLENLLSRNLRNSDIGRINRFAGISPVSVSPETLEVIRAGIAFHAVSEGYFDITVGPLVSLWDIGGDQERVPAEEDILRAVSFLGIDDILIEADRVTLSKPNMQIDLGGIAKGYIADRVRIFLKNRGCSSALINVGGNIVTLGTKPDGTLWRIGIQTPFSPRGDFFAVLHLKEASIVTSGMYERFFIQNETLYHHILNPFSGYPVDSGLMGVTVISDSSMDGDALSTTMFSLGLQRGLALAERIEGVEAIFYTTDREIVYSSGINKTIRLELRERPE